MAVPATVDEFLDLVRKSGVADEKRLDAYLLKMRAAIPPDPSKAAGQLVADGVLTNFQAENILLGKWRRFSIGKYKVLERLGSGGFAQVFLCEHKLMRRRVAVKVLPAAKAKDSSALDRFIREARAVAALDHPNIVHAYDIDQDEDLHFLVMEYVDGSNLQEIIKKSGPLDVLRACHYMRQSALALQHAHEHGLVHRDIKPGNILVDRGGVVKVLDMGLARFFHENDEEDQLTKKHDDGTLGTADYLSPEQATDSHEVDIRTDIYSLGITFYYLLTGRAPFEGMQIAQKLLAQQIKQPKPISDFRKDVPAELLAVINKMMAKDRDRRYLVPGDVADALLPFTEEAIAPPPDLEMPRLSPAAGGAETAETATARHDTPVTPARTIPGSGKRTSGVVVSPAPRTPLPKPKAPAPAPLQAVDNAVWPQSEVDTGKLSAQGDTTPRSSKSTKKLARPPASQRTLIMALVVAILALSLILVSSIGGAVWWFSRDKQPTPVRAGPPKLEVSRDRPGAFRTLQAALAGAKVGSIIELWDEAYKEDIVVDPAKGPTDITLQAAPNKSIVWGPGKDTPDQPIIRLTRAADFKLKGKGILLDGTIDKKRQVNDLIMITSDCPGLSIEDLQFMSFARSAVFIMNSAGSADHPIKLARLKTTTEASEKGRSGIYFDANPKVTPAVNDYIEIQECVFEGIEPAQAIQSNSKTTAVFGDNVRWPGK